MEHLDAEFKKALRDADFSREILSLLMGLLEHQGKGRRKPGALKLVRLLGHLKKGKLINLSAIQKKKWLENLLDLLRQGEEAWTGDICDLFFGGKRTPACRAALFPEDMVQALLGMVKTEKAESVREILWDLLLRQDTRLETLVNPDDVIPGLWENNPIVRNNVVRFLYTHYSPDDVVAAICNYALISGKRVPGPAFKRYVGLIKGREALRQKKALLKNILNGQQLEHLEIEEIWADYLKGLNRFELVTLFTSHAGQPRWVEALEKGASQLSFSFKARSDSSGLDESFHARIRAIQDQVKMA